MWSSPFWITILKWRVLKTLIKNALNLVWSSSLMLILIEMLERRARLFSCCCCSLVNHCGSWKSMPTSRYRSVYCTTASLSSGVLLQSLLQAERLAWLCSSVTVIIRYSVWRCQIIITMIVLCENGGGSREREKRKKEKERNQERERERNSWTKSDGMS